MQVWCFWQRNHQETTKDKKFNLRCTNLKLKNIFVVLHFRKGLAVWNGLSKSGFWKNKYLMKFEIKKWVRIFLVYHINKQCFLLTQLHIGDFNKSFIECPQLDVNSDNNLYFCPGWYFGQQWCSWTTGLDEGNTSGSRQSYFRPESCRNDIHYKGCSSIHATATRGRHCCCEQSGWKNG